MNKRCVIMASLFLVSGVTVSMPFDEESIAESSDIQEFHPQEHKDVSQLDEQDSVRAKINGLGAGVLVGLATGALRNLAYQELEKLRPDAPEGFYTINEKDTLWKDLKLLWKNSCFWLPLSYANLSKNTYPKYYAAMTHLNRKVICPDFIDDVLPDLTQTQRAIAIEAFVVAILKSQDYCVYIRNRKPSIAPTADLLLRGGLNIAASCMHDAAVAKTSEIMDSAGVSHNKNWMRRAAAVASCFRVSKNGIGFKFELQN